MKVLVLDLSRMARRLISDELLLENFEIIESDDPEHALQTLATVPGIGLFTTAVALDSTDGFELISRLRSDEMRQQLLKVGNHDVPVIVVTGNDTDADRLRGFRVGAADFIQKPWQRGQLARHVDSVLGHDDELMGMTVLVADDSATTRAFVRTCLNRLGVNILEAEDGVPALEILQTEAVDLVLTDLNMLRMDGDALCMKIRENLAWKELPVIVLSADDNREKIISLFRMGATDYLTKPFLQEELMARLKVHLHRGKLLTALSSVVHIDEGKGGAGQTSGTPETLRVKAAGENRPPRILLVDDGPVNLAVGSKLLQDMGCQVDSVTDGDLAVSYFEKSLDDGNYDIIFMDLMMPTISGQEAAQRIREMEKALPAEHPQATRPVPIIALSASHPDEQRDRCLEAGINDFQSKPLDCQALRTIVEQWLPQEELADV